MAMKEFAAGERLFAADLNDNFDETQSANNIISGTMDAARIGSGTLNAARIPDLNASKITTGTLSIGRLPSNSIVSVKNVAFNGTQSNSTASRGNFAVSGLTITHSLQSSSNKLLLIAFLGAASNSRAWGGVGIAIADGGTLINIGISEGTRARVTAGGLVSDSGGTFGGGSSVTMPHITTMYSPGTTASKTYTVRAINVDHATQTVVINRAWSDGDAAWRPRAVSAFTLIEVKA